MAFTPGSKHGQMADINMTPLIDVMLVLLIIFMVAAPMLTTGVDVKLPESRTGKSLESEALVVTLARDGALEFDRRMVSEEGLRSALGKQAAEARKRPILVRADHNIPYGRVIAVVDMIREAGFSQVGFVTQGASQFQRGSPAAPETPAPPRAGQAEPAPRFPASPGAESRRSAAPAR